MLCPLNKFCKLDTTGSPGIYLNICEFFTNEYLLLKQKTVLIRTLYIQTPVQNLSFVIVSLGSIQVAPVSYITLKYSSSQSEFLVYNST